MTPIFVLIHSPLVGPYTWKHVARAIQQQGLNVVVPTLISPDELQIPYWEQHAGNVAQALQHVSPAQSIILVGHSGAGPILPAIRAALPQPVAGYVFVDAGLPTNGMSRLDQFSDPQSRAEFRQSAVNGLLPVWTEEDLQAVIPDNEIRRKFVEELHPLPLNVYEEKLPVFSGWPDAPCAYLEFGPNPAYEGDVENARKAGWPHIRLEGEHFHMLVDPDQVTRAIMDLVTRMEIAI